jgi:hypothetical protein
MKLNHILLYTLFAGLLLAGCKHKREQLPAPEQASFEFTKYIDPTDPTNDNTYIFRNTSNGTFLYSWDFGGIEKSTSSVDTVFFAYKGIYKIKLMASSKGGTSTLTKDLEILQTSPYAADFTISQTDAYHFDVTVTTPNVSDQKFTFANGDTSKATTASVYFPFQGTFAITLRVVTVKGPSTLTKYVTVANSDPANPALSDNMFTLLTGGVNDLDGKTWKLALPTGITGVGPYKPNAIDVSYYSYPASDGGYGSSWVNGAAANEYTFIFNKYQYVPLNQKVTVHYNWAVSDFGKPYIQYNDLALTDPNHKAVPFILKNEGVGMTGYTLSFGEKSYFSYMDGRRKYEIAKISADSMWVRHKYSDVVADNPANDANQRVLLYVKKP